jgi:hypothetical protein
MAKHAYIEFVNENTITTFELTSWDLWRIGKFTRENIERWLRSSSGRRKTYDPFAFDSQVGFHAVCGDIDISWEFPIVPCIDSTLELHIRAWQQARAELPSCAAYGMLTKQARELAELYLRAWKQAKAELPSISQAACISSADYGMLMKRAREIVDELERRRG